MVFHFSCAGAWRVLAHCRVKCGYKRTTMFTRQLGIGWPSPRRITRTNGKLPLGKLDFVDPPRRPIFLRWVRYRVRTRFILLYACSFYFSSGFCVIFVCTSPCSVSWSSSRITLFLDSLFMTIPTILEWNSMPVLFILYRLHDVHW